MLGRIEFQPEADEFMHLHPHAEQAGNEIAQARCTLGGRRHQAGKAHLGHVRDAVEAAKSLAGEPDMGADIALEAVVAGAVVLGNRPHISPGAEEQLEEAVVEQVEKARQGVVVGAQILVGLVGQREGQRSLGTAQAEELHE